MEKATRVKKKRMSKSKLLAFLLYEMVFLLAVTPLLVFRGPFKNVKNVVVGTIMATRHQYLATIFLPKAEVDGIISKSVMAAANDVQNKSDIKVTNKTELKITRSDIHTSRFDGYILEISNPLSIRVGVTKYVGKVGQRTSEIAEENGAVAAINGGAFYDMSKDGKQFAGTGAFPGGRVISEGKLLYSDVKDNDKMDIVGFTREGVLVLGDYTYAELKKMDVTEGLSFGGTNSKLIINGKAQIHDDGGQGLNPRTAIGQRKDGTVIFLVADGRGLVKNGASLREIQDIMLKEGAWNASNLDGGSSSTMYYNGKVINSPSNWDGERTVATAFFVKD